MNERQNQLLQAAAAIHEGGMESDALEFSVAIAFELEKRICRRLAEEGVPDRSN
jgi:hypothetical protein